jgi:phenylacetic acid degradation operon negative regulatory protein
MRTGIRGEEVLTLMMYGVDLWTMPSLRKWDQSYEGWLYAHGLLRRVQWLETQKHLQRQGGPGAWVFSLTEKGRKAVTADVDPEKMWQRKWDGWWRQLVFDLPVEHRQARDSLLRWLKHHRFGYLQDSVWISPDPITEMAHALEGFRDDAEAFTLLECRCVKGFSDAALVGAAWLFEHIKDSYGDYLRFATRALKETGSAVLHPQRLFELLREERRLWLAAFNHDPLLPGALWPQGYNGPQAQQTRDRLLRTLTAQVPR